MSLSGPPQRWPVAPLGGTPIDEVSDMLSRAFAENPVARAALSHCDEAGRLKRVTGLHRGLVRALLTEGVHLEVVRAVGRPAGASLSFAPGVRRGGVKSTAWMARGAVAVGVRGVIRYLAYEKHVGRVHPSLPHAYLFLVGVEPAWQGRGVGSALIERFCARADDGGVAAYLETDKLSSVRLYERHGFVVRDELEVAELGGLRVWTMLRPARTS